MLAGEALAESRASKAGRKDGAAGTRGFGGGACEGARGRKGIMEYRSSNSHSRKIRTFSVQLARAPSPDTDDSVVPCAVLLRGSLLLQEASGSSWPSPLLRAPAAFSASIEAPAKGRIFSRLGFA